MVSVTKIDEKFMRFRVVKHSLITDEVRIVVDVIFAIVVIGLDFRIASYRVFVIAS